jgi:Tol biopolymer transport system component
MKSTPETLVRPIVVKLGALALAAGLSACAAVGGAAPTGGEQKISDDDAAKMKAIGAQVKGRIVWSSSRLGNHDLFAMDTDGSNLKQLTTGEAVDWFPRYSPDGRRIMFVRSRKGWVSERDANAEGKWDLYLMPAEGGAQQKIVSNASWGTWVSAEEILFVRSTRVYRRKLSSVAETLLVDSETVPALDGALLQQPEMSHDGKYIAITLRGSKRETGIWDVASKTWTRTGDGCQINWTPDGHAVYWVHPTGNGGSRVFRVEAKEGKLASEIPDDDKTFIDLPGRRSHEYFPELSPDGNFLVWAATQRGHDHDIADYEIYLWKVGSPPDSAARLTFHSGNDRWPDIYIPGGGASASAAVH